MKSRILQDFGMCFARYSGGASKSRVEGAHPGPVENCQDLSKAICVLWRHLGVLWLLV